MLDEQIKSTCSSSVSSLKCVNYFEFLVHEECRSQKCKYRLSPVLLKITGRLPICSLATVVNPMGPFVA